MSWRKDQGRAERGYHHGNLKEALLQAALDLLDAAVREVKAQIEEARGDVVERNRAALDEEIREAHTIARRGESQ